MSWKKIVLFAILADFVGLTLWAVWEVGYLGFFEQLLSSTAGIVAGVDLIIALGLILAWMLPDARERGVSPIPYVVLTFALGSVGPLLYLLRRPEPEARREPRLVAQAG